MFFLRSVAPTLTSERVLKIVYARFDLLGRIVKILDPLMKPADPGFDVLDFANQFCRSLVKPLGIAGQSFGDLLG